VYQDFSFFGSVEILILVAHATCILFNYWYAEKELKATDD